MPPIDLSNAGSTGSGSAGTVVTLSDTVDLAIGARSFVIAGPGPNGNGYCDIALIDYAGNSITIQGLACGVQHWIYAKRFKTTGTTAGAVVTAFQ